MVIFHSYGLAGAVISDDLERCDRVSKVRFYCIYMGNTFPEESWRLAILEPVALRNVNYKSFFSSLQALNAGIVWINCSQPCFCQAPWGGKKRSGFGRELGPRYVLIFLDHNKCKVYWFKIFVWTRSFSYNVKKNNSNKISSSIHIFSGYKRVFAWLKIFEWLDNMSQTLSRTNMEHNKN